MKKKEIAEDLGELEHDLGRIRYELEETRDELEKTKEELESVKAELDNIESNRDADLKAINDDFCYVIDRMDRMDESTRESIDAIWESMLDKH
ncbi:MAG: hypothetical protein CBC72_002420 [Gammaproteobacteria bacterium TMED112]|nr:MAG: hypothetical protein CBC72_002420 [Gammaproteobacteria bacterium TMED112]